jgi:hypothetical protein
LLSAGRLFGFEAVRTDDVLMYQAMTLIWERNGDAYHTDVTGLDGETLIRLIVEPYGDLWDWIAWRPGEDHAKARQGIAGTVQDAMRDAESVVGTQE